jgi:hypothetical protein
MKCAEREKKENKEAGLNYERQIKRKQQDMKTNCDTFVTQRYMDGGFISFQSDLSVFKTHTINPLTGYQHASVVSHLISVWVTLNLQATALNFTYLS